MLPLSFYTVLPFDLHRTCELLRVALEVRDRTSSGARSFGAGRHVVERRSEDATLTLQ